MCHVLCGTFPDWFTYYLIQIYIYIHIYIYIYVCVCVCNCLSLWDWLLTVHYSGAICKDEWNLQIIILGTLCLWQILLHLLLYQGCFCSWICVEMLNTWSHLSTTSGYNTVIHLVIVANIESLSPVTMYTDKRCSLLNILNLHGVALFGSVTLDWVHFISNINCWAICDYLASPLVLFVAFYCKQIYLTQSSISLNVGNDIGLFSLIDFDGLIWMTQSPAKQQ